MLALLLITKLDRPQDSAPVFIRILNSTILHWIDPLHYSVEQIHFFFTTTPFSRSRPSVHVIIGTDNRIITYPIDKRFGLVISSDNLIIKFLIVKPFGLVEWIRGAVEELSGKKAGKSLEPCRPY